MIVELFGPPGVGKTTFASSLAAFLCERGHIVDPVMSYRPAERALMSTSPVQKSWNPAASARRLARPTAEMVAALRRLSSHSNEVATTSELMRLLPPSSIMWSIRLRQYLLRLFQSWNIAAASPHVVLFDQAFIQAVCSLALLARVPWGTRIDHALDAIPKADLLIQLDAPQGLLATRLGERRQHQGRIERLLELDLQTNLASIEIIEHLHASLLARGRPITWLRSADRPALHAGVARAGADIVAALGTRSGVRPASDGAMIERAQHA